MMTMLIPAYPSQHPRLGRLDIADLGHPTRRPGPWHRIAVTLASIDPLDRSSEDVDLTQCGLLLTAWDVAHVHDETGADGPRCGDCFPLDGGDESGWAYVASDTSKIVCVECGYVTDDHGWGGSADEAHDELCAEESSRHRLWLARIAEAVKGL